MSLWFPSRFPTRFPAYFLRLFLLKLGKGFRVADHLQAHSVMPIHIKPDRSPVCIDYHRHHHGATCSPPSLPGNRERVKARRAQSQSRPVSPTTTRAINKAQDPTVTLIACWAALPIRTYLHTPALDVFWTSEFSP